jgi:hypothetical protein
MTRTTGTLHEDVFTFMAISGRIILGIRNVSDKFCTENQNTNFMFNNFPPLPPNRAIYEIMEKNMVQPEITQMTT